MRRRSSARWRRISAPSAARRRRSTSSTRLPAIYRCATLGACSTASAERYIYIEEQYFWIEENALDLHNWLKAKPERFLFLVIPRRFADIDNR